MKFFNRPTLQRMAGLAAATLAAAAAAQTMLDPTKPMASLLGETAPAKTIVRAAAPAASVAAAAPPRLQAVQLSNQGTASALLDGRVVHVGDRVGEASVVAIDGLGITLRGARGDQRLSLLSGVTKTASRAMPEPTQARITP